MEVTLIQTDQRESFARGSLSLRMGSVGLQPLLAPLLVSCCFLSVDEDVITQMPALTKHSPASLTIWTLPMEMETSKLLLI